VGALMANFDEAFAFMLPHEGGYVFDTHDPGGETKFGISKKSYPKEDIAQLTKERACEIYRRDFWKPVYEQINSQAIANKVFDFAVNMGAKKAHQLLQSACNDCGELVAVDGGFGSLTLNAVNSADSTLLLEAYKRRALGHYQHLVAVNPILSPFIVGWARRAMA
jgi:lysozyme family protein